MWDEPEAHLDEEFVAKLPHKDLRTAMANIVNINAMFLDVTTSVSLIEHMKTASALTSAQTANAWWALDVIKVKVSNGGSMDTGDKFVSFEVRLPLTEGQPLTFVEYGFIPDTEGGFRGEFISFQISETYFESVIRSSDVALKMIFKMRALNTPPAFDSMRELWKLAKGKPSTLDGLWSLRVSQAFGDIEISDRLRKLLRGGYEIEHMYDFTPESRGLQP